MCEGAASSEPDGGHCSKGCRWQVRIVCVYSVKWLTLIWYSISYSLCNEHMYVHVFIHACMQVCVCACVSM